MRLSIFNTFNSLKMFSVAPTRFSSTIVMLKRFRSSKKELQEWLSVMNGYLTRRMMWIMHNL